MAEQKKRLTAQEAQNEFSERAKGALVPPVDIYEDSENVTLFADLPGVDKDGLDLQIDKDTLHIFGKLPKAQGPTIEQHYTEFPEKDFYRAFTIGDAINKEKITASINNGVLKLVLPKSESVKPKKIDIKVL